MTLRTNTGTPRQYRTRHTAPAAPYRAALSPDTAAYLGALATAAQLAAVEAQLAAAGYGLRLSLAPHGPEPVNGHADDAATAYPPALMFGTLATVDADRAQITRRIATFAAQWYAAGALFALEAMLTGNPLTPAELEGLLDTHNSTHPGHHADVPAHGIHNRPALRPLRSLATGHNELDTLVGAAWADLTRIYASAHRLEAHHAADGTPPGHGPRLDDDEAAAAGYDVERLHTALKRFADLVSDAARFGHGDPAADYADEGAAAALAGA